MRMNRWIYAAAGVVILLFAGLVYAWSVLSIPISAYFTEWSSAQLSFTFTICMAFFCLGGLIAGTLAGRINVKINMIISAVLFLSGFTVASNMQSLIHLYLGYGVMAGMASGFAYNTTMGTVTKFFPDKPGLISGILSTMIGSSPILIIGFIVAGLGYGGITPTNSAFVGASYGKKNYAVNFSIINMNLLIASFGSTIAGMLYDASGSYFTTYMFMAAAVLVGGISGILIKKFRRV